MKTTSKKAYTAKFTQGSGAEKRWVTLRIVSGALTLVKNSLGELFEIEASSTLDRIDALRNGGWKQVA